MVCGVRVILDLHTCERTGSGYNSFFYLLIGLGGTVGSCSPTINILTESSGHNAPVKGQWLLKVCTHDVDLGTRAGGSYFCVVFSSCGTCVVDLRCSTVI